MSMSSGFSASPLKLMALIWRQHSLIWQMAMREALGRYRGSVLGVLWSFITPLILLSIYTFVFTEIFNVKWTVATSANATTTPQSKLEFAVVLFAGLIVFNLFAECISKAPLTIVGNPNLVKKLMFPLELLPLVNWLSALFHMCIAVIILQTFQIIAFGNAPSIGWLLPVILVPLSLLILGLSWFLASLGVYVRDISQTIGVAITGLMFISPIFFPITAIPKDWQFLVDINPLATPIDAARDILVFNKWPNWQALTLSLGISLTVALIGFAWFQKTRRGFADVL
jgi:lipopolysaccharide transport system permease protein